MKKCIMIDDFMVFLNKLNDWSADREYTRKIPHNYAFNIWALKMQKGSSAKH